MRFLLSLPYVLVRTNTQTSFLPVTQHQHNRVQTLTESSLRQNPANVTVEWVFVIRFWHCKQNLPCTFKSERENKGYFFHNLLKFSYDSCCSPQEMSTYSVILSQQESAASVTSAVFELTLPCQFCLGISGYYLGMHLLL